MPGMLLSQWRCIWINLIEFDCLGMPFCAGGYLSESMSVLSRDHVRTGSGYTCIFLSTTEQ